MGQTKKIISYNVNGIRAAIKKGLVEWMTETKPDVLCLQETKALQEQVDTSEIEALGYHCYWFSAQKKGYSGVAVFTLEKPVQVVLGTGIDYMDFEGRNLRVDFPEFSVMSVYLPSGTNEDRQEFKFRYMDDFYDYLQELREELPKLIVCGDYNICHEAIDIHDPVRNKKTSGFLPNEREWVSKLLASGFVDSFRHLNKEPHHYSWWTYRANARNNNKGWRIDYNMVSESLQSEIAKAYILPEVKHSDHCPVVLEIKL